MYAYSFMLYTLLLPYSSLFDFFSFFVWYLSSVPTKPEVYLMSIRRKSPFIETVFDRSSSSVNVISTLDIRLCQTTPQSYLTFSPDSSSRFISIESLSLIVKANIMVVRLLGTVRHSRPLYALVTDSSRSVLYLYRTLQTPEQSVFLKGQGNWNDLLLSPCFAPTSTYY